MFHVTLLNRCQLGALLFSVKSIINDDGRNDSNCNGTEIFKGAGHPLTATISIISVIFNILIILTIKNMIKRKMISSKNLFMILGISDLSVGVIYTVKAIFNWFFKNCEISTWFIAPMEMTQTALTFANRGITLYMTLMRAITVSSKQIWNLRNRNKLMIAIEIVIFVAINCLPEFIAIGRNDPKAYGIFFGYFVILTILMLMMAVFILIKLHLHNRSISPASYHSSSTVKDDFQRQVIAVAFIFCFCHLFGAIIFGLQSQNMITEHHFQLLLFWFETLMILNSCVNLIIYIVVSRSFRRVFLQKLHIFGIESYVLDREQTQTEVRMGSTNVDVRSWKQISVNH